MLQKLWTMVATVAQWSSHISSTFLKKSARANPTRVKSSLTHFKAYLQAVGRSGGCRKSHNKSLHSQPRAQHEGSSGPYAWSLCRPLAPLAHLSSRLEGCNNSQLDSVQPASEHNCLRPGPWWNLQVYNLHSSSKRHILTWGGSGIPYLRSNSKDKREIITLHLQ